MKTLADRLERMLDERGFSISEAARHAGMEKQQLYRIVRGQNANPGILTIERILGAIGGTMGELYAEDEEA